ncbi:G-D-S-L family lipolytic protein [Flavobacterium cyclinae]|uniref:G-D-S-L family lipolytic protein n=1 Tax=Flavobacterium cyclinae TaxID=2895947 RepID=UPI001E39BB2A|nr:G-D-S-L family lipolytic protein [Flavobacterium cyclinae]UGS21465.1 G-D-S-L family lipolytic protein [Flavobacterium cyclinae]
MKNKFIYLAIIAAGFASCEPEFENEVSANYTSGDADFTTYVAVGNSLTAGYMDGTVSRGSQTNSFPNLLAQQFALVGGGEFTQPSYADDVNNLGGLLLGGFPIASTRLVIDASEGRPENIAGSSTIEVSNLQATAYNNMGVPGAKSFHLIAQGYGNIAGVALGQANPYFVRHATSPTTTVLGDAMSKNPTFFTNWIGANDVLSYATNGGAQSDGVTPANDHNVTGNTNPATYGANDITNSNVFASVYSTIITTLTSNGAKGVVCTIPSVTSIPYFTTVPYAPVSDAALNANPQAALLVQLYQFLAVATNGRIAPLNLTDGVSNPVLINDADLTDLSAQITFYANNSGDPLLIANASTLGALYGKARQTTSADLIVLPASSVIGTTSANPTPFNIQGVTQPLANKWILTSNEKNKVANATAAYNATIVSIANSNDLAVADMNAIMNQLVTGLRIEDGTVYTANYFSSATASSVLFSLDGVHPNAKGYGVIANEIIKVINNHYNANIPYVYAPSLPGATILQTN